VLFPLIAQSERMMEWSHLCNYLWV